MNAIEQMTCVCDCMGAEHDPSCDLGQGEQKLNAVIDAAKEVLRYYVAPGNVQPEQRESMLYLAAALTNAVALTDEDRVAIDNIYYADGRCWP